jgi:hypothetical protein
MNLSGTADWADSMLKSFDRLSPEEQDVFSFIPKHRQLIIEMKAVFQFINTLLQRMKIRGLSNTTVKSSLAEVKLLQTSSHQRVAAIGRLIEAYIREENGKRCDRDAKWHISSDIIESLFGSYKERKSPNAMNGVTKQIFFLPLLTRMKAETGLSNGCFKTFLEHVLLKDLDTWKDSHLSVNRTVKRKTLLCA